MRGSLLVILPLFVFWPLFADAQAQSPASNVAQVHWRQWRLSESVIRKRIRLVSLGNERFTGRDALDRESANGQQLGGAAVIRVVRVRAIRAVGLAPRDFLFSRPYNDSKLRRPDRA